MRGLDNVNDRETIPTRQSLLARLKDCDDQESWRQFFESYWRLIHATALKAGLLEVESEEVVQEVMIAAARKMPEFSYVPGKDSLKGWLLAVTRWKIGDQFRKRQSGVPSDQARGPICATSQRSQFLSPDTESKTASVERLPGSIIDLESIWDSEWHENLLRAALDCVKRSVNPAHYERYHLHVVQGLSAKEAAKALGVSRAAIHLAKHRVGKSLRAELRRLQSTEIFGKPGSS
jgi:RNA polymerase sigma-70 factor (ECF subfamily)